jgi:uncharacterized protein
MSEHQDPRYLSGIERFNRGEYFDAHEIWEDLWQDCPAFDRRFYQGLIQAAVAIYHFERGNYTGAARLAGSGKRYMGPYGTQYRGLNVARFWQGVESYIVPALSSGDHALPGSRPVIALQDDTADEM